MKKIFVLFLVFSSFSCTSQNKNKMLLGEEIGFIGDTANFKKEILFLDDLDLFSDSLNMLHSENSSSSLINFYRKTIALIDGNDPNDFLIDLKELCEVAIEDIELRENYEFADLMLLWNDLRLFYSSALDYKLLNKDEFDLVTLSETEYSKLIVYESALIIQAKEDKDFESIYAYQILDKQDGKTKIAFYTLII